MNDNRLTEALAIRVMGWRLAPGRFIKPDRGWTPSWRFAPLIKLEDAFELLDVCGCAYTLSGNAAGEFEAEVRIAERVGKYSGKAKPRVITIALARALGELPAGTFQGGGRFA